MKVFIQNVVKCLGVIFREVRSSSQSVQMKHIHFNYWPLHRKVRFAAWVIKMALLISPNVYQPSSHYRTSLIMQHPRFNRASLNVYVSALCIISLKPLTSQPPRGIQAHTPVGMFTIWTSTNIRFGQKPNFLRLLLKAHSVAVCLGAPARPVWPLSIKLKISSGLPLQGGNLGRNLLTTFSHSIKSMLRSIAPFLFVLLTWEQVLQK